MGKIDVGLASRLVAWGRENAFISATVGVMPVDHARNESVRKFLSNPKVANYTHLLFVDEDTVPPPNAIAKLLALDADVATGVTPIMRADPEVGMVTIPNAFTKVEHDENKKQSSMTPVVENSGVVEVVRAGASCLLIKRKVFESLQDPWFKFKWLPDYSGYTGEDLYFCDLAREKGFKIMCDTSVICQHAKTIML